MSPPAGHYLDPDGEWARIYDHPYNATALNERGVELAEAAVVIGSWEADGTVLEVGNVLSHYPDLDGLVGPRRIVDRFEVAPGVENIDVFDIRGTFDYIVSISTLEHVGVDDGRNDPESARDALSFLRSLLNEDGEMFVTFPYGWNRALDASADSLGATWSAAWHRDGFGGWVPMHAGETPGYGVTQPWAEAVWVGTFGPLVTQPS